MPPDHREDVEPGAPLPRQRRAIVIVDVVESVRLAQQHEDDFFRRWMEFIARVLTEVLPAHGGTCVKSLGDGLLLTFPDTAPALAATLQMQTLSAAMNAGCDASRTIALRGGVHVDDVVIHPLDIFGAGVNLTARLATLAGPGQVVLSQAARQALVDGVHASFCDLGPSYLKHLSQPVRAYRADDLAGDTPQISLPADPAGLPLLLVCPTVCSDDSPQAQALARVITDDLAVAAGRLRCWRSCSRLVSLQAASAGRDRDRLAARVDPDLSLLSQLQASQRRLHLQLLDVQSGRFLWESTVQWPATADPVQGWAEAMQSSLADLARQMLEHERAPLHRVALPSLPAYRLLLQSITQMHSLGLAEFDWAERALDQLLERHPRSSDAHAWMAKWRFLQIAQRRQGDVADHHQRARQHLQRALQEDAGNGLALAIDGHLQVFVGLDLDGAEQALRTAVAAAPNEPLAWLFWSNVLTLKGEGAPALAAAQRAMALSPLDPLAYLFDHFAARAARCAGDLPLALQLARRSVRANRLHLSSLVDLIVVAMQAGEETEARTWANDYLSLRPNASVQRYVAAHPDPDSPRVRAEAWALREAGLPP